jgi:hypothetical protein
VKFSIVNGLRVAAFPKGKGTCPFCGNYVVAKCGNQNAWHWAHSIKQSCDPWWENETQWHRDWKGHWNEKFQEVVHFDSLTGEKHIADVKNQKGFVLEFQNSPMNDDELSSRERFYGDMAWVVNAMNFYNNIEFGAKLPNPELPESLDMCVRPVQSSPQSFIFHRISENEPDATMVEIHGDHSIQKFIDDTHVGHYLFAWKKPRTVWFRSARPVFFDFGQDVIWRLQRFNARSAYCLEAVSKVQFISRYGGTVDA